MTTEEQRHLDLITRALQQYKGDDHIRARNAFKGLSPEEMQKPYGYSGNTCAEVLAEYEQHAQRCDDTIAWVQRMGAKLL